ncbi:hypothetical protein P8452_59975 [Trifolium repens]|nr:hypothetical protein P8452_59975 [Trifolium repens]
MAENMSDEQVDKVSLTVFVKKEVNKVVYAEAGKDFVDALFSFLTLPLGTIARLVAEESNIKAARFGSVSSLYQSVKDLDENYLFSHTSKEILLKPSNSMSAYCQKMKLNVDDTELLQSYFVCEDKTCKIENMSCVSTVKNEKCICGKRLNRRISENLSKENGFVKEGLSFIVSDDLYVVPNDVEMSLRFLQHHGVCQTGATYKQTVYISKKEVVDLLKLSFLSKTALTDFLFNKEHFVGNLDPKNPIEFWIGEKEEELPEGFVVKVVRRKSNKQILFVEAKVGFVDFVFSFLTYPLGGLLRMIGGYSFISCIDNIYKSMTELSPERFLRSQELKDLLTSPRISYKFVDPKSPISGAYTKDSSTFMVTNDLVVSPMSSINVASYLKRMNVSPDDLDEGVLGINFEEGVSILKASLTSTSALTKGLKPQPLHNRTIFAP